jgi:3-oxoadipate enol-lactonase
MRVFYELWPGEANMASVLTERVLERAGCPLHYWLGGPAGRPLVVFTHGACVDHRSFDAAVPVVARDYRVLTWDVRGHGRSTPMGEAFTVPLAVEDLSALVDTLGDAMAVYVGHSNGTYIAQELAFRRPERVRALVIADGTCVTWKHSGWENFATRIAPALMALFPYETLKRSGLSSGSARKDVQDYTYEAFSQLSRRDFLTIVKGVSRCLHSEPNYRITQPLLLMHGDDDRMGDIARIAPQWAAREPNCRYVVIPSARHFAVMDNPDFFTSVLLEFLAQWAAKV